MPVTDMLLFSKQMNQVASPDCKFVVPTYVDEFDAVVGDGVEGDGDVLQLVVLVLRTLVVPSGDGCDDDSHLLSQL